MNTKEIALAVNKTERSVQNWIRKVSEKSSSISEKSSSSTSTHPADYDLSETLIIIEAGMGKNAAALYAQSTQNQIRQSSTLTERDIEMISKIVSITISETIKQLDSRVNNLENQIEKNTLLLPAPGIKPRDHINKLVREYANKKSINFPSVWSMLYKEHYYRFNHNLQLCAKNRNISVLDYAEQENKLDELLSIANTILN